MMTLTCLGIKPNSQRLEEASKGFSQAKYNHDERLEEREKIFFFGPGGEVCWGSVEYVAQRLCERYQVRTTWKTNSIDVRNRALCVYPMGQRASNLLCICILARNGWIRPAWSVVNMWMDRNIYVPAQS